MRYAQWNITAESVFSEFVSRQEAILHLELRTNMTDFQAVAPPAAISNDGKSAFADAVQRAKQIAAKIGGSSIPGNAAGDQAVALGLKRPLEDLSGDEPLGKKVMAFPGGMNDPMGGMFAMKPGMPGIGCVTESYQVPSSLVGLIIGRGGETISKIQDETGCKLQVAPQNDIDNPEVRTCTLTGAPDAIQRARQHLDSIVYNSKEAVSDQILIKANKVGLIIGKKGETIRKLMEQSGARMMMIQDSTQNTGLEKPLKITGDQSQVERAKELINELMEKQQPEYQDGGGGGGGGGGPPRGPPGPPGYGGGSGGGGGGGAAAAAAGAAGGDSREFTVPRQTVGIIIGKKGDMIRDIQEKTGARVQFQEDDGSDERVCIISGPPHAVERAHMLVEEIVESAKQRDMERNMGMRGRGRGRGGGPNNFGNRGGYMGSRPGMMRDNQFRNGGEMRELPVAPNRCGLIIGRGGANIQAITAQSGARVEMTQRLNQQGEKIFTIQGTMEQVNTAETLILDKLSQGPMGRGPGGGGGGGGYNQGGGPNPSYNPNGGGSGWGNNFGSSGGGGGGGWGHPQGQPDQQQPGQDPGKSHEAAWQAYYQQQQQFYQPGQPQAAVGQQPSAANPQQQSAAGTQPTSTPPQGQGPNAAAGQVDYTNQWAEYYKQQGELMGTQGGAQPQSGQPDYSAAWAEYFKKQQFMYANPSGQGAPAAGGQAGQQPNQQATGYPQ